MTKQYGLLLATAMLLAPALAQADELDARWYLAPGASYIFADDDRQADDGPGFQLGIGKAVSQHWNLELNGVYDQLDLSTGGGQYEQTGLGLDGLFFFDRSGAFNPYLVLGAGALKTELGGTDSTNLMANAGAGFMARLNDYGLALRADARYRLDNDDSSLASEDRFGDWLLNLGLAVPLGAKARPAPPDSDGDGVVDSQDQCANTPPGTAVDTRGCIPDSDGDGVIDTMDRCPGTPTGTKVDATGCETDSDGDGIMDSKDRCPNSPPGTKVDATGCEMDSDGDGIMDSKDRCPNSPPDAKVDATGCEVDSDGDGLVDSKDRCPHSPVGAKVDARGCEIPAVITLKGVTFNTNSAELTEDSLSVLDEAAATLRSHPELVVEVAGHTDNRGNHRYNVQLSQRRAEAVRAYLVSQGANGARLSAKGYGPDQAVADNGTAAGRAANRRVELRILGGR